MRTAHYRGEIPLSIINHPPSRLPGPSLLHRLVRASPVLDGNDAIDFLAADGSRRSLSYADLHASSDSLAVRIAELAHTRSDSEQFVVPLLLPQGPELYIAQLAILKAGGAFCPLNLDIPAERARLILDDVSAKVVITVSGLASKLPAVNGRDFLVLDNEDTADRSLPSSLIHRQAAPSDLAYVMYTSGSTGTPKGVGISHEAATQSLLGHDRHIPDFSRFLQFAAPTFDVSVFEIFFPLMRGKTLVSCARSAMLDDLPAVLRTMNVDGCELTPSVAGSLLRRRDNASNLRLVLTIGEMLTIPVIEEFGGREGRSSVLWGMYGPTEAAIHCTVQPAFSCDSPAGNIGVPFDTVSAFIVPIQEGKSTSFKFDVLPLGEVGELVVGGFQLARDYINRPEQTAAAFIDTPYGRLYRTGDKARMKADGTIECLGRIGFGQVKLRGQRVELGEIEHAALRISGCHGAFAVIVNNILVLFCAVDDLDGTQEAIARSCREWLPGFMYPGDIVVARDFPRQASGKVDRKLLIENYTNLLEGGPGGNTTYVDDLVGQLCILAGEVLGTQPGPSQRLAGLGMDSLGAIKFASALRAVGVVVGALDILESQTPVVLANRIRQRAETLPIQESRTKSIDLSHIIPLYPELRGRESEIEAVIPSTPLQTSMLAETSADPRAYWNWVELELPPNCSETVIRSCFLQIASDNESLRTGFLHHEDRFLQVVFKGLLESCVTAGQYWKKEIEISEQQDLLCPLRISIFKPGQGVCSTVLIQIHHAIYDGWSMDLILADLEMLIQGKTTHRRPPFQLVTGYQQSPRFQQECNTAKRFWAKHLSGFQYTALPNLLPEVTMDSTIQSLQMPLSLGTEQTKASLRQLDCSAQSLFQAALVWLWGAFLGTDDVVIGVVTSGRTLPIPGLEDIVGPCISVVPTRIITSHSRTIRDLITSVHATNRMALPHSILPLAEIQRTAQTSQGRSLYDILFVYQESLTSKRRYAGAITELGRQDFLETKILVEVEPGPEAFTCRITWHSDKLSRAQVEDFGGSFRALSSFMLENLDLSLPALQSAFPPSILSVYNQYPKSFCGVPDLAYAVESVAARCPDKDALCFADCITDGTLTTTTVTFDGLNKLANQIAWCLRERGIREGDVVAIVMQKSVLLYASIMAILKAGAAYLPLLPSTPTARVQAIFGQANLAACLVDRAAREMLGSCTFDGFIDVEATDFRDYPRSNLGVSPDPSRIAYVIFTSGSTGIPKGVCVTQLNIISNLDVLSRIYPRREDSRLLQSCSQAFDVSVFEIFFAWTEGMCLCSGTNDTIFEDLERSIRKLKVTHLSMTPTVASLIEPENVPGVEFLVTAGEAMTGVVAQKWSRKLYQGYGPSETTNICSAKKMDPMQNIRHLGWAFENTSTFVLFPDSEDVVPRGCFGELCFGGDQVAQGYLGQPDLTSAKFINHPQFGRLYRSGDLGRMLPDGSMVIIGRVDEQIKIRGQRVELGEITSLLRQSREVVDSVTLVFKPEAPPSHDMIVSFAVLNHGDSSSFHVLGLDEKVRVAVRAAHQLLLTRLPSYMVPSLIIPISVLPTTASGKLDKNQLVLAFKGLVQDYLSQIGPALDGGRGEGEWSDAEKKLANVISTVFGLPTADIQRWLPLSTIGLDSISAIQLARDIERAFGRRLALSEILQNATVARLAVVLSEMQSPPMITVGRLLSLDINREITNRLTRENVSVKAILPCMPLQEAMLATSAGQVAYVNKMLFAINCDQTQLKQAWSTIYQRQDILRTLFVTTSNQKWPIVQVILEDWQLPWYEMDASATTVEQCVVTQTSSLPTALDSLKPAVSFALITQGPAVYLSFVCHHALYDGVAIQRLLFEVEQQLLGEILPYPPSYENFLQEALSLPASTDDFWSTYFREFVPKLTSQLTMGNLEQEPAVLAGEVTMPLSTALERIRDLSASLQCLGQAAWASTIACLFRDNDICFGNVVSGRSLAIERIDEVVAPCFNTIPIRMDLSDKRRNIDLMKAFQELGPDLMAHQFSPLRRIQAFLPSQGNRRLFDTLLLVQQPARQLDKSIWRLERDDGEMDVCYILRNIDTVLTFSTAGSYCLRVDTRLHQRQPAC